MKVRAIHWTLALGGVAVVAAWILFARVDRPPGHAAEYRLRPDDADVVALGQRVYQAHCVACHGAQAKGNPAMGAPNLTDNIWLYGGLKKTIMETIEKGRAGRMPAHAEFLGEAKVHLLAAYVYSLSHPVEGSPAGSR